MVRFAMMAAVAVIGLGAAGSAKQVQPFYLIPGSVPMDKGPDGNSIFLDAPGGLILIDTGRHPEHAQKLLAYAKERGRPIAAILHTHWHMDHVQGNLDIRRTYPAAHVYATSAIDGALPTFLANGRKGAEARLKDPRMPAARLPEIRRYLARMDSPDSVRPTLPVNRSGKMTIAGRQLDIHVAPFAATEADLWIYSPDEQLAIVGDLVVDIVPFMDTACTDGWKKALEEIAATPFVTLIPGHGAPMDRAQFLQWKGAFNDFVVCGSSSRPKEECVAGWKRDAAPFIDANHEVYAGEAAAYYIDTRLRSSADEQGKYCKPLRA